jgi:cyanophycinase
MPARGSQRDGAPGPLALVGGDEFRPGNQAQDELLVRHALSHDGEGAAYVIATAARRQDPDRAVATARDWFAGLGLAVAELRLRTRREASNAATVEQARNGRFFYLAGGDPGLVPQVLAETPAWAAILEAWRNGAVLAGSSAGAMALGAWTLIRARHPGDAQRDARPALDLVPGMAVVPHLSTFGHRWVPTALPAARAAGSILLGIDERTAALWSAGDWHACGPGEVVVFADVERRYRSGERIEELAQPSVRPRTG